MLKNNNKITVGQKMYIKSWEQLMAEFGIDEDTDNIKTPIPFTQCMRHLCGKKFTISCVVEDTYGVHYFSEEKIEFRTDENIMLPYFIITADMLRCVGFREMLMDAAEKD